MSIIAIGLCIYYLKFYIKKKILFKKKRFNIIILIIIITAFFIPFLISKNKIKNHEKEDEINKVEVHYYCYRSSSSFYDSSDNTKYTIPSKGVYSICVYGAKAKEGGRGGKFVEIIILIRILLLNVLLEGKPQEEKVAKDVAFGKMEMEIMEQDILWQNMELLLS